MKNKRSVEPPVDMKMPLEAVAAIMNGAMTELDTIIRIDDSKCPQGVPVGQWAAQQLVDGKAVRVYDVSYGAASGKYWNVTLEMLRSGLQEYLTAGMMFLLDGDTLDAEALEPDDSIPIIALGVFGTPAEIEEGC